MIEKALLLCLWCVVGINAGTETAHYIVQHDQMQKLFYDLCTSGKVVQVGMVSVSEKGSREMIHCKQPILNITMPSGPRRLFVESPEQNHKHKIFVHGQSPKGSGNPETTIYIVPPKIRNQYEVEMLEGGNVVQDAPEPKIVFLPARDNVMNRNV